MRAAGHFEEVVVVAAHFARGHAVAGVVQRFQAAQLARKELLLHVGGDLEFALAAPHGLRLLADGGQQAVVVPGLLDEIAGAAAHRFHRQIDVAPGGHHHHRHGVALRFQAGQQVHAFLAGGGVAGVVQVGEDQVEGAAARRFRSSAAGESAVTACQPWPLSSRRSASSTSG